MVNDNLQVTWSVPRAGWWAVELVYGPLKLGLLLVLAGPADMPRGLG